MLSKLFAWTQGRHTAFVTFFTAVGTVFQWYHRLDPTYIGFVVTMMGFVLGHSIKEDLLTKKEDSK